MKPNPRRFQAPAPAQQRRCVWVARALAITITLVMVGLLGRVAQLQYAPPTQLAEHAAQPHSTAQLIARRGQITDRQGRALAVSHLTQRLFVDPTLVADPGVFAVHLAHAIGDDPARIDQLIGMAGERQYVVIADSVTDKQAIAARELKSRAIGFEPRLQRDYPAGPLAGQLVGFVGAEHKGLDGVEYLMDSRLRGENGQLGSIRDARRRAVWLEASSFKPPRDGRDVALSIDTVVQAIAERELATAVEKFQAEAGQIIVMDSRTGQMLAMVNWPFFDPRKGGNVPPELRRNRCVTDPYEPGSIFKPMVWAAITSAGAVNRSEKLDCTEAGFMVTSFGRRLHDSHGHGRITWDEVLVLSSNIGMAIGGMRLEGPRMYNAVRAFGFGELSGSGLSGESVGIVNPLRRWNQYSITSIPMGQEIAVTPVQMVRAFSAFANGGRMVSPSFLASDAEQPIFQRAIDRATADTTRQVLRRVVTDGTGKRANSERYSVWGKTGTAQVPDREHGGYIDRTYTGSFICGAPLDEPRIIVNVVIHRPDPKIGYYGGTVAGPVAKAVVEQTLEYLGVPPSKEESQEETQPDRTPVVALARAEDR